MMCLKLKLRKIILNILLVLVFCYNKNNDRYLMWCKIESNEIMYKYADYSIKN